MRCPACGGELASGEETCARCAADDAGRSAPPADPNIQLVSVFSAGDPALIALARSLLDGEGIEYAVRNDDVQDLFGWGRVGANFNVVTGPAEFVVREEDAPRATDLLRDLDQSTSPNPDDVSDV